jgi:GTP cyclohydrolase IA
MFSQRLQVQERLTTEIGEALVSVLKPKGLIVVVEATHFCMAMRGVKKQGSTTITHHTHGLFASDEKLSHRFFSSLSTSK